MKSWLILLVVLGSLAACSDTSALQAQARMVNGKPDPLSALSHLLKRAPNSPIQHIVLFVKENRTFDNLFGTFPGANGATTYKDPNNQVHPLNHEPDALLVDISHTHNAAVLAWNGGQMNQFSLITGAIQNGVDEADSQLYQSDIPNYWSYAQTFALSDAFFSTIAGPSLPNHLFTIAGQDNDVSDNPNTLVSWGCDAPSGTLVKEIHPDGSVDWVYPCFNFKTLADELDANGISWKYYAPPQGVTGYIWSTYDSIDHIRNGADWQSHVVDPSQFAIDAGSGNLPAVSWVVEEGIYSEHPPASMCIGENYTVNQINAVMQNSSLWANTAMVLTWDDFGGFYDHVVPPGLSINTRVGYGFRLPTLMISPYSRPGSIDHTFYSMSSLLKFVENNWSLPALTTLDANANDLAVGMENYQQQPLPPLVLNQRTCPGGPTPTPTATGTPAPTRTPTNTPVVTPTATPQIPGVPTLLSPANGAMLNYNNPLLTWTTSTGATFYKLEVHKGSQGGPVVISASPTNPQYQVNRLNSNDYFWRVEACNGGGCSSWTGFWEFTISTK